MAIVTTNPLVNGLSGMLGRSLVFKNLRGKTIVASRPRPPKTQSEQQRQNRSKFRLASAWAKTTLLDSQKKAYYLQKVKKLKLPNAYTAAIADYMRKPQVKEISRRDDQITYVVSKKDFELKSGNLWKRGHGPAVYTDTIGAQQPQGHRTIHSRNQERI